ncbi:MAG: hypothetical protein CM15mL5_0210 [uncultured marine virus]|nr:MAG: hypothetical protein CM15mL5_0210 [uncultured marine virus]
MKLSPKEQDIKLNVLKLLQDQVCLYKDILIVAEHWVVVEGTALVHVDGETSLVIENQSTYIPVGVKHRLQILVKYP